MEETQHPNKIQRGAGKDSSTSNIQEEVISSLYEPTS